MPPDAPGTSWRARLTALTRRDAVRAVGTLVGGTVAAHAITAAAMPVSTRLFTPNDFSVAAGYSAIVGIVSAAACLRYDIAVPVADDDAEAANLLAAAVGFALLVSATLGALFWFAPLGWFVAAGQEGLYPYRWMLPLGFLAGGLYLALQAWAVRRKSFGAIARSRVGQSVAAAGGQIGLGAIGVAPLGLIVGQALNYGAGALSLGVGVLRERVMRSAIGWSAMLAAMRKHQRFPRYSVWEALANAASINLPILFIVALAAGPEAGYLTLANFILLAPMALLGNAVGQVYFSAAPEAWREKRLAAHTEAALQALVRAIAAPLVFVAIVSPAVFGVVFGPGWERAGILVAWMTPWFLLQFLASPTSAALHVTGQQRAALVLQLVGLTLRVGAVLLAANFAPGWISESYALSGAGFYAIYLIVILRVVGITTSTLVGYLRAAMPFILLASAAGIALVVLVTLFVPAVAGRV